MYAVLSDVMMSIFVGLDLFVESSIVKVNIATGQKYFNPGKPNVFYNSGAVNQI